jgi:glycosyltransferase
MQDHRDIEHIVIDGGSTDGTLARIERYREVIAHVVSGPDKGVYDAMNKGLGLATGEVIAFVNAGDMIAHRSCVAEMVKEFVRGDADVIYGDAYMVDPNDIRKVKRFWRGGEYDREKFRSGWMPPHLGTYIRKSIYDRLGHFRDDLRISADYELLLRFLYVHGVPARYVPKVLVRFRLGGVSNRSLVHIWRANREVYRAWQSNGLHVSPFIVIRKPLQKLRQYLR